MKFKNEELQEVLKGLDGIINQRLPVKTAYWMGKAVDALKKEFKHCEETRLKLCMKYCTKDENNKPIIENGQFKFDSNALTSFNQEFKELMNTEIEIDFRLLKLEDFGNIEASISEMLALERFIEEVEIEKVKVFEGNRQQRRQMR